MQINRRLRSLSTKRHIEWHVVTVTGREGENERESEGGRKRECQSESVNAVTTTVDVLN